MKHELKYIQNRSAPITDPISAIAKISEYADAACRHGCKTFSVFILGDNICWSPFKLKSHHPGLLFQGNPATIDEGLTLQHHRRIYNTLIHRNDPKHIQMELFK